MQEFCRFFLGIPSTLERLFDQTGLKVGNIRLEVKSFLRQVMNDIRRCGDIVLNIRRKVSQLNLASPT